MKIRLSSPLQTESIVDGPGFRAVVWTQGCPHKCIGCHNPKTHDFIGGKEYNVVDIKNQIKELKLHKGITLSGGEPFNQPTQCLEIIKEAKKNNLDIWCYTGYTFDYIINQAPIEMKKLLKEIDVLIDGKYQENNRDLLLNFKGSSNQRIIDVDKSFKENKIIEINY